MSSVSENRSNARRLLMIADNVWFCSMGKVLSFPLKGWLRSLDQSDSVGRNDQPFAGKAEMFLGGGLYAHSVQRQAEGIGDILTHSRDVGGQLRPLA